ncbi:helix-turn-helix domain-containing protein [uncultured Aquimarina sp.]|uniref:MarR family transcriptional regulator n=1 Tax=uncultured Aquimarina sp. TaxID=575652 RepID=UPI002635295B|nr:helix-turn-helix domain-containing protein [uncultured Aquimarina sp.]
MDIEKILDQYALSYKEENYPPVAGKILGLFFISNQKHFTFEEIMSSIKASKSATSKAVKLLISSGEINFEFLEGNKRKRHFFLDIEGSVDHFKRLIEGIRMQTELYKETLKFRTDENEELSQFIQNVINLNVELSVHAERLVQKHFLK